MHENVVLVVEKLEELAKAIGIGVKVLWPYLVKQQYVWGAKGMFWVVLSIMWFIGLKIALPKLAKYGKANDWDGAWIPTTIVLILGTIAFGLLFFNGISNMLRLFNPEYYAFRSVMAMLKTSAQ